MRVGLGRTEKLVVNRQEQLGFLENIFLLPLSKYPIWKFLCGTSDGIKEIWPWKIGSTFSKI